MFKTDREYCYFDFLSQTVEMIELAVEDGTITNLDHVLVVDALNHFEQERKTVPADLVHVLDKAQSRLTTALEKIS